MDSATVDPGCPEPSRFVRLLEIQSGSGRQGAGNSAGSSKVELAPSELHMPPSAVPELAGASVADRLQSH